MRTFPVLLLTLGFILACMGSGSSYSEPTYSPQPGYEPKANFVIGDTSVSHACAGLLSDCSRALCIVINSGDAVGNINVDMTVTSPEGQQLSHGESLVIEAGDRKTVSYDFQGFEAASVVCTAR
jgi:hypothetical protein